MSWNSISKRLAPVGRATRTTLGFTFVLLVIEFMDEIVDGARAAAWPLIRNDLNLTYAQIGLLLTIPELVSNIIEPPLGILGDLWKRRVLVVGGGFLFSLAVLLVGLAPSFGVLLLAFVLFYPASSAFVSLSQATLMDLDPARHEQWMARWELAGSLGVVAGPLALSAAALLGFGWRGLFVALALLALLLTFIAARQPFPNGEADAESESLMDGLRAAGRALRRWAVLRWLFLLECADLMNDVIGGFVALYFVDVVGTTPQVAAAAFALWSGTSLLGDFLVVPLLTRVRGLVYLRWSVLLILLLYPAFLLAPTVPLKMVLLAAMGLGGASWYAILQGNLYSAMPGRSGTVMGVSAIFSIGASFTPALLGLFAERVSLEATLWLLVLGPLLLLMLLPRNGDTGYKMQDAG
jgi:MFS transporter, FSR family, fosmidomycin resistance protein